MIGPRLTRGFPALNVLAFICEVVGLGQDSNYSLDLRPVTALFVDTVDKARRQGPQIQALFASGEAIQDGRDEGVAAKKSRPMIREISPRDQMHYAGRPFADEHYFHVGASSLRCIDVALRSAGIERIDIRRVLDMPCGHGRVMRYIRAEFPHAEITACDLDRDGVDFCAKAFGAHRLYSQEDIKSIALPGPGFDLIWVGSLFTHLQPER